MSEPRDEPARSAGAEERHWSGAHTCHRLRFHLVWTPKYRKRVLTGPVAARLSELLAQACEVNDWEAHELSIQPDHIHLLLQIHPRESVAKVMQRLKGGTSKVLRAEFPELDEFLCSILFAVGRPVLGGRLLRGDGGRSRGGRGPQVHPQPARAPAQAVKPPGTCRS